MVPRTRTTTPLAFGWLWAGAAAVAAAALVAEYGFREPQLPAHIIRILLMAAAGLSVLSRLVLLFPGSEVAGRLRRWWVDYALLAGAGAWWVMEPAREPVILRVAAIYTLALGLAAGAALALGILVERIVTGRFAGLTWRVAATLAIMALAGGLAISLPVCWSAPVTGQKIEQYAMHLLNCCFTAAAAVTCTGLTPLEVGEDFSLAGQVAILVLLQTGGLTALVIGTALGIRLRELGSGGVNRHSLTMLRWTIGLAVAAELAGAAMLYSMWDASRDPVFAATAPSTGARSIDTSRVLFSVFHAVSAFCNGGLTLSRDRLAGYAWQWQLYGIILPLMILGSIGGPTLFEVWGRVKGRLLARWRRQREAGGPPPAPLSGHARWTLWSTLVLVVGGALLLWGIESTRRLQLRYPREDTPGRLQVESALADVRPGGRIGVERMRELPAGPRLAAAIFTSASARTTGLTGVRLDEASLSPASRWVLMLLMLVGGGIGGTAGGVRILTAVLCLRAVLRPGRDETVSAAVWSVVGGMLLLIAGSTFVLLYRDVGSPEASLFESVSAVCNVGFSTGLTRQLYVEAKLALIVTMLLGRAIPLGLLARLGEGAGAEITPAVRS